jgi:hypothetical protein
MMTDSVFPVKRLRKRRYVSTACKCGAPRASVNDAYCRDCRAEYMRQHRRSEREELKRLRAAHGGE